MIAIVVVCYNRIDGLLKTVESLQAANYDTDEVTLVISIDKSDIEDEIVRAADNINWSHGEKIIRTFNARQGLRPHILQCGDLTNEYEAVIILEDDVTVAPGFYLYTKQAIEFYRDNDRITGISLYSYQVNQGCQRPFFPANNGYDAYFLQFAQSWGQCWTSKMWQGFRTWYNNQNSDLVSDGIIPDYVVNWDNRSWLKYYVKYTADVNGYFVYPYYSLSTNNSSKGEHCEIPNNDYQVTLQEGYPQYRFPDIDQAVKYDAFFERVFDLDKIFPDIPGKKILDLYGLKNNYFDADVLITTKCLPYKVIYTFQLKFRPQEINCILSEPGEGIFVYDLNKSGTTPKYNPHITIRYDIRALPYRSLIIEAYEQIKDKIRRHIFKTK